jgi:hypothetical protein
MSRILSARFLGALLAIGLLVFTSPLRAEGKLETIEKFTSDKAEMIVATFLDPGEDASKNRVGLIGIGAPKRNSFAFDPKEWAQLMALCDKAIAVQATSWTSVGTMTETGTTDVSKLVISAGPGVRFVISSPKGLTVTYVLRKTDAPRFQKALGQVRDFLAQ